MTAEEGWWSRTPATVRVVNDRSGPDTGWIDRRAALAQRRDLGTLLAGRPGADRVLDCGGPDGPARAALAERFAEVRTWDPRTDAEPDGEFDVITACAVFGGLSPDARVVLVYRLAGLLAPGGVLVLAHHGRIDREVRIALATGGLQLTDRRGYGWLPDRLHGGRLTGRWARLVDAALLARTTTPVRAARVVYVARRR